MIERTTDTSDRGERGPLDTKRTYDDRVDGAGEESFPASDPPAVSPVVGTGAPGPDDDPGNGEDEPGTASEQVAGPGSWDPDASRKR